MQSRAGELKEVRTQVDAERTNQKPFEEVRDAVRRDRVHAYDHQRECPFLEALDLDHPTERGEEQ